MLIEGVATFLCRIVSKSIAELEPRFGGTMDAFIGTALVVAGNIYSLLTKYILFYSLLCCILACDYSGGYFNPVLATSLKLNCQGNTLTEHLVVYWIGSIAGSTAAFYLFKKPIIHDKLVGSTPSSIKEKVN